MLLEAWQATIGTKLFFFGSVLLGSGPGQSALQSAK